MDGLGFESVKEQEILCLRKPFNPALGPTQAFIKWILVFCPWDDAAVAGY
jgi:hypothetical protein